MTRYGYFGMDEDYSDVNTTQVKAICSKCQRRVVTFREEVQDKDEHGIWITDDLCSELPDEIKPSNRFTRPHEWH